MEEEKSQICGWGGRDPEEPVMRLQSEPKGLRPRRANDVKGQTEGRNRLLSQLQ